MTPIHALLAFTAWTLLLVALVFLYRGLRFMQGTPINAWPRGNKPADDAPLVKRIEDAHANCLENLPLFAVIVLAAADLGKLDLIAPFAAFVFYARVAQSLAHLSGTGKAAVFVRANFWVAQLGLMGYMLSLLLK
ncbi:MAG: MAPEG family protein [Limnobacter sp.]|uniref:MAPEG family protein n=1 Tax=Limnobacter sp. TaxID=2003368 RepID=UPI00391DF9FB